MSESKNVRVGKFEAEFQDLELPFGLTVDIVRLQTSTASLSKDPFRIDLEQPGQVQVLISEPRLGEFLNKEQPGGLRDFEVELKESKVHVHAAFRMIVELRAHAICHLQIRPSKRQIDVVLESVDVMGVGAKNFVQSHIEKINPIVDTADFPLDIEFEAVLIADGKLVLKGSALPRF